MKKDFKANDVRLNLRPVKAGDEDFVYRVYASTRELEMALVDWPDQQKEAFIRMQLNAQTIHYKNYFLNAQYYIIQRAGVPVGRFIMHQSTDSILVIDIALLTEHRGNGIGTAVMQNLMQHAAQINLPILLRVEGFNPALSLYARLGFVKTGELNLHDEMTWTPQPVPVLG